MSDEEIGCTDVYVATNGEVTTTGQGEGGRVGELVDDECDDFI